jgi:UDP:flavonoid glycosyltransferase YjiC (YdhE family)
MKRLRVARVINRLKYTPFRVARRLRKMLDDPLLAHRAASVAERLKGENGTQTACDALEALEKRMRNGNGGR